MYFQHGIGQILYCVVPWRTVEVTVVRVKRLSVDEIGVRYEVQEVDGALIEVGIEELYETRAAAFNEAMRKLNEEIGRQEALL